MSATLGLDAKKTTTFPQMPPAYCTPHPAFVAWNTPTLYSGPMTFESKIWAIETISARPIYALTQWQAFDSGLGRSKGRSRHFVGAPGPDINPVISGTIVRFDPGSSCGATASQQVCRLDPEVDLSHSGKRMWSIWLDANKASDVIDLTSEIVNLMACPPAIYPPLTDDEGDVRELTAADLRTFKPASAVSTTHLQARNLGPLRSCTFNH